MNERKIASSGKRQTANALYQTPKEAETKYKKKEMREMG